MIKRLRRMAGEILARRKTTKTPPLSPLPSLPEAPAFYASLIAKHIPYFELLLPSQRKRFLDRAYHFRKLKEFYFSGIEPSEEIAALVSAAATQLCFGLEKYQLEYFSKIYILPDAYHIPELTGMYIGHVAPTGIYLSWKHFLEGYGDSSDNINVALHEMAHALEFDHFLPGRGIGSELRHDLEQFREACGPILVEVLLGKTKYLRPYAYRNLQEFWAVSVEAFFENPLAFRSQMPELYYQVSEVLNQDTLVPGIILPE